LKAGWGKGNALARFQRPSHIAIVSIELLQQELAALPAHERRRVQAFLVALEDSHDAGYRRKLSEKIDKPAGNFATLEELDRRLKTTPDEKL
jgi:hypothetical protein